MITPNALQKILDSVYRGNCCLVVGPRHRGKSKLVRKAAENLSLSGFYRVTYVSMREITQADSRQFYRTLFNTIHLQIRGENDTIIPARVHSASDFQNAILELMEGIEDNLLLQIDDLELAPPNLISLLLGSIRSVFTTVANRPGPRFQAIVSGTVNLHQLALRGVSRFESISDLILVDDMTLEEAHTFATDLFSSEGIELASDGLEAFLAETSSDPVLIRLLAGTCIEQIKKRKFARLTPDLLPGAVAQILKTRPNFEIAEALSQIEGDPELLSCFLRIAQKGEMQVNELPLRSTDSPNALDLCGVFHRTDRRYSIKSPLWHSILKEHFSSAHCGRLYAIAGYWDKAIEYYGKAIHNDKVDKKSDLFSVTINGMQASGDDRQAVDVLAQGLHACYPNCEIGIYVRTESALRLEHFFPGKSAGDELLKEEIQLNEQTSPEVEALFGPDYSIIFRKKKARFLIPLRVQSGMHATGLISYCGGLSRLDQHKQHEEILQMISFLNQAARAIDGRRKYSNALRDAKSHTQTLESLDYILTSVLNHLELDDATLFRLLLAGLTANECLGFNRAALFLFDEDKAEMVGIMGVGHLTREEADFDWKNFPHHSLNDLLDALIVPNYKYSPLHSVIESIRFPIREEDVFGRVHHKGMTLLSSQLATVDINELPKSFLDVIEPAEEFAVAPLTAGTQRLGLVYVDNKHTHGPIDGFQLASLSGFLTQAALVMEMARSLRAEKQQRDQEKRRLQLEETLRITSLIIGSSLKLKEVLHRILVEMKKVLPFDTASIQLANEETHSLKIIANSGFDDSELVEKLVFPLEGRYPNVLVYEEKVPLHFDDIQEHFKIFSDPHYQATHVHGWLGAPLIINNRVIGVITLDSKTRGIYTSEHDRMAVLFAGQASVAIENARLFEAERGTRKNLEKVENNLRLILGTVGIMSGVNHSEAGLFALAERIVNAQPVTFCNILLLDESKQNLILKVAHPNPRSQSMGAQRKLATGERISLLQAGIMPHLVNLPEPHVFQQGQMITGMDVIQHLQQYVPLDEDIRSILIVPLNAGSEVIGICILGEARSWNRSPFDEGKVELVSSMVTQGIVFVDRLRAHEATQNKLIMVERLRSIGEALVTASPGASKSILDKVVRAACEVTGASSAVIYPWDKQLRTYDNEKIVHFGLTKKKSFSDKIRDEEGSMTSIVLRKRMVIVDDIQKEIDRSGKTRIWADRGGFLEIEGVHAFVGVSLGRGDDALGVLFVNFLEPHYFSDGELEAVNLFANQAAIAIENARLYEDLALKLEESSTLQKVGILLAETRDSSLVLDRVVQAALELIYADEGNILFYDESKDEFLEDALMSAGIGLPLQKYKTRVRQRSGYSYEIIRNIKPIRIPDTAHDPRINQVTLEKGRKAVLGVPLIGRENPVGVLWVNWKTPHRISEHDERLLMALASQAAVFIENVNLFDQLKSENIRRNEESLALQKVGISLTESIELNEVLYRVLQAALELIQGDEDSILFYDESRAEFKPEGLMCAGLDQPIQPYRTQARPRTGLAHQIVKEKKPIFIPDTRLDSRISKVAIEKGRRAMVGVPLLDNDGPVGVLWVNWKEPRQVSSMEASLLTALASQATVAIKGARRYEEIKRRSAHLQAVHEAGKVISAASVGLNRQQVLDRILQQAIECVTGVFGSRASFGSIQILEEETKELVVESVFPPQYSQISIAKFDHIALDPKKMHNGKIGITGRAAVTRLAQLVPNVNEDEDYISHNDDIKSELAIPILDNGRLIGVMDVESKELNAFDELDKDSLGLLVDLAVVALQNADRAEQLTRSNAVALMGAWGAEIVHVVNREVGYIRREVFLIGQQPVLPTEVREGLRVIDQSADHLALPEIPERLPGYESMVTPAACLLDTTIHRTVDTYRSGHPTISFNLELGCPDILVAMHERFLHLMVNNLLRNAEHALSRSTEKKIFIRSLTEGPMVVFEIEDTGPGLNPDRVPSLFKRLIPHTDGRKGRGLLLVGFIVEQHGGRIEIIPRAPGKGAFFRFWLPLTTSIEKTMKTV